MNDNVAIYYATMTGNAEELARDAEATVRANGWTPLLHNLSEASPSSIKETRYALFIVSTWGEGEPPDDAAEFFEELENSDEILESLHYAMLGLGDSSYPDFNAFARNLNARLTEMGACKICDLIEADYDFEDSYALWMANVLQEFSARMAPVS